jgi:hypothetical protein
MMIRCSITIPWVWTSDYNTGICDFFTAAMDRRPPQLVSIPLPATVDSWNRGMCLEPAIRTPRPPTERLRFIKQIPPPLSACKLRFLRYVYSNMPRRCSYSGIWAGANCRKIALCDLGSGSANERGSANPQPPMAIMHGSILSGGNLLCLR